MKVTLSPVDFQARFGFRGNTASIGGGEQPLHLIDFRILRVLENLTLASGNSDYVEGQVMPASLLGEAQSNREQQTKIHLKMLVVTSRA